MRNTLLAAILTVGTLASCDNSNTETTSSADSTSSTSGTMTTEAPVTETSSGSSATISSSFDESGSYVSLKTKKPIRVKRGESASTLVDYETNEPLSYFFYNPATKDTFDYYGNVVNGYLITGTDGTYQLDEPRWKTKVDSDGDIKSKDGDETKIKTDASSGRTKIKTDTSKIKINN